jgi:hypothetical protein
MTDIPNFLAPDEDDYETTQPIANPSSTAAPAFGEPGFGKGKSNPRKGTPRARVTERDIPIVYFLGHFPGADAEACSLLNTAKTTTFGDQKVGGGLTSVATTKNRLDKLRRLGVVEQYRHPVTGTHSYGLTAAGFSAAREYGLNMDHGRTLSGLAPSRLAHYRAIALVAAKFASPSGYFAKAGIAPVPLESLISENQMRAAYEPTKAELKDEKAAGRSHDFGKWRAAKRDEALALINQGSLAARDLIDAYPVLLTLGQPQENNTKAKPVHQPDLALNLDGDRTQWSKNIFIEVELSLKNRDEYTRILATYAAELAKPHVGSRVLYFTIGTQVGTLLRQIDADEEFGLFDSGRLVVLSLTDRNNRPLAQKNRISIGGN